MPPKILKKQTHAKVAASESCYDLALWRMRYLYEHFDHVAVSFSGGKDSTACLNLALMVAREVDRLPVHVFTFDEECIPPETVEYMARVGARPDVAFTWYCLPIAHRNACSSDTPYWFPWAPEDEAKWVRPLPAGAIATPYPGFVRGSIGQQTAALFPPTLGTVATVMGIRTQESLTRFHAVASKRGPLAFIGDWQAPEERRAPHVRKAYPIYDWLTEDVWRAPGIFDWDYNRAYDLMDQAGIPRHAQRCAPPFGEQPIRRLDTFKTCWPELWAKMVDRVPGAATAARYANTELYAIGVQDDDLPPGLTWQEYTLQTLRALPARSRREAADAIRQCIVQHNNRTKRRPIPDATPDPDSGYCWKILFIAAKVGGNKFDRQHQKMANKALAERQRSGAKPTYQSR